MCGIVGIYGYHPAAPVPDRAELIRIRDHMAARGPDGAGEWISEPSRIAFGHRRLSIIDLSDRASQPMRSADGKLSVTFNGEIYNYRALRSELEQQGHVFRTQSDTEVLLHLYAARGRDMVRNLRGMFAFAIWDENRRGLFLARDPYGIKPLYYTDDGQTCRFASQVAALHAGGKVSRDADPRGWVGFYYFGSVPEPLTTYRHVRALPAGSTLWVDRSVSEPVSYVHLPEILSQLEREPRPRSTGEASEVIRAALFDSLRHHMVADVPVGLFLSAGVDSGSLLGLMRDAGQTDIQTVTLAYDEYRGTKADEAPLAAKSADQYGCRHTVRTVTETEFREDLPRILEAMDQPTIDGINTWFVSKAARELGLKVAISGLGGDELFGGYPSFRDIPRLVRALGRIPGVSRMGEASRYLIQAFAWGRNPKFAGILKFGGDFPGAYFLMRGLFMPWEIRAVIHDADFMREGFGGFDPLEYVGRALRPPPRGEFSKVASLEASFYLRNQLLRDTDWASMAHSLEVRVPYVDIDLLKAIWPAVLSLPRGSGKQFLAGAPSVPLPAEVVARLKTGFGTPVDLWLQRDDRLQDWRRVRSLAVSHCPWARRWAYQLATSRRSMPRVALAPRAARAQSAESVLIFRIGSIGDTVCAIPCFHQVARKFPNFHRILLTDIPTREKGAPVEAIIGNSGLVDEILYFPANDRTAADLLNIRRQIRKTGAKTLVYIADRPLWSTLRDILFFYSCGIQKIIGAPLTQSLRFAQVDPALGFLEHETERLTRCLSRLGPIDLTDRAIWDLRLTLDEQKGGQGALAPMKGRSFIAVNLGGKVELKDWGDDNWAALLQIMSPAYQEFGVVFFGSSDEWDRCERMGALWAGPVLNLCGALTPRESAAALKRAALFIGHDSGPMHLAAAVGVLCVAIFGNYNAPNRWHPYGARHRVIHNMDGVRDIAPNQVSAAVQELLEAVSANAAVLA